MGDFCNRKSLVSDADVLKRGLSGLTSRSLSEITFTDELKVHLAMIIGAINLSCGHLGSYIGGSHCHLDHLLSWVEVCPTGS